MSLIFKIITKKNTAGYTNMVHVDISPSVIKNSKEWYPELDWRVGDATQLSEDWREWEFDYVLEKGTFDAIEGDKVLLKSSLVEVKKVAKRLVSITLREESRRQQYREWLDRENFE